MPGEGTGGSAIVWLQCKAGGGGQVGPNPAPPVLPPLPAPCQACGGGAIPQPPGALPAPYLCPAEGLARARSHPPGGARRGRDAGCGMREGCRMRGPGRGPAAPLAAPGGTDCGSPPPPAPAWLRGSGGGGFLGSDKGIPAQREEEGLFWDTPPLPPCLAVPRIGAPQELPEGGEGGVHPGGWGGWGIIRCIAPSQGCSARPCTDNIPWAGAELGVGPGVPRVCVAPLCSWRWGEILSGPPSRGSCQLPAGEDTAGCRDV